MDTKKKPTKKILLLLGGGILISCLCIVGIVIAFTPSDDIVVVDQRSTQIAGEVIEEIEATTAFKEVVEEQSGTSTPEPSRTPAPTKTPKPSHTPAPTRTPTGTPDPNLVDPGMYIVNSDIKPGIYRGAGSCYWERLKDVSGSFEAIIANGNTEGQFYIEIKETDYAFSINCKMTYLESLPEPKEEYAEVYRSGMYLVGRDIPTGIYRGNGSCYWERLSNVSGGFDAIIANYNSAGQFYVQLSESDFAFTVNCDVVPLDSLPEPTGEFLQIYPPGMYLVGRDMPPATYQGDGSCYWERLRNVSGDFNSIIANDNPEGQFYVQVSQSDFAFFTTCNVESVGD